MWLPHVNSTGRYTKLLTRWLPTLWPSNIRGHVYLVQWPPPSALQFDCLPGVWNMTDLCWGRRRTTTNSSESFSSGQKSEISEFTFHKVQVSFAPNVSMQSGEDADGLGASLLRSTADLLQLNAQLIWGQRRPVAVVHVQLKELRNKSQTSGGSQWILSGNRGSPHLKVVNHSDVFGRLRTLGMIHHRVPLQAGDPAGREHLIVLVHAQRLSSHELHRESLTGTQTRSGFKHSEGTRNRTRMRSGLTCQS